MSNQHYPEWIDNRYKASQIEHWAGVSTWLWAEAFKNFVPVVDSDGIVQRHAQIPKLRALIAADFARRLQVDQTGVATMILVNFFYESHGPRNGMFYNKDIETLQKLATSDNIATSVALTETFQETEKYLKLLREPNVDLHVDQLSRHHKAPLLGAILDSLSMLPYVQGEVGSKQVVLDAFLRERNAQNTPWSDAPAPVPHWQNTLPAVQKYFRTLGRRAWHTHHARVKGALQNWSQLCNNLANLAEFTYLTPEEFN